VGTTGIIGAIENYISDNETDVTANWGANPRQGFMTRNASTTAGSYASYDFRAGTADARIAMVYQATNDGDMQFIMDNTATPLVAMTIENDGEVGIGTTLPAFRFHVYHSDNTVAKFESSDDTAAIWIRDNDSTTYVGAADSTSFIGGTGALATTNLNIDTAGYIGLGTTNPTYPLDIQNSAQRVLQVLGSNATQTYVLIGNSSTGKAEVIFDASNGDAAGGDYCGIGQYDDLRSVWWTAASAGNISIWPKSSGAGEVQVTGSLRVSSTIFAPNIGTGVDNSVVILDSDGGIKTDEINSLVWDTAATFPTSSGANDQVAVFVGTGGLEGDSNFTWDGSTMTVNGDFRVGTGGRKNFWIDNPRTGGKLTYDSLEGPSPDVFFRGTSTDGKLECPEDWAWLVDVDSITVQLTAKEFYQDLYYKRDGYSVEVKRKGWKRKVNYDYVIHGTRCDID
jgi:hypothetical protein